MNRRQAKKAYKKRYGHNPPKTEVRFYQKYWAQKVTKAIAVLPDIVQKVVAMIREMVDDVVERIQTMEEEDFNKFLESSEMEDSMRILAKQIRAGRIYKGKE